MKQAEKPHYKGGEKTEAAASGSGAPDVAHKAIIAGAVAVAHRANRLDIPARFRLDRSAATDEYDREESTHNPPRRPAAEPKLALNRVHNSLARLSQTLTLPESHLRPTSSDPIEDAVAEAAADDRRSTGCSISQY